jgi:hypothetical protein
MKENNQDIYQVHVIVSNQSFSIPVSDIEVHFDGKQIFHREMRTGTQHSWESVTLPVTGGKYTLLVNETKTRTRKSEAIDIHQEMWIVITFHSPPNQIKIDLSSNPVYFM